MTEPQNPFRHAYLKVFQKGQTKWRSFVNYTEEYIVELHDMAWHATDMTKTMVQRFSS